MKKLLSLLLSIMLLTSILTGCGEKTESQDSDLLTDSSAQGEVGSDSENEALSQSKEGLQITLNGENEAKITLNDEAIGQLGKNTESNLRILLQGEGATEFESESEIYISSISWHLLHFTNKDTGECEIIVDGSSEGVFSETNCTITMSKMGICSYFDNIENYRIVFTDANKENLQTTVASGKLSDVLCTNSNEQQHILQAIFQNDETIKLKIYGDEAKTSFYNHEDIRLAIYESEEQVNADNPCPSLEITAGAAIEDSGEGRAYAGVLSQDGSRTGHDLGEDSAYPEGRTLGTDYGVVMKYKNQSIGEYVKPEYLYELYFGNDKIEVGKIRDIFVEEEYTNIPAIPNEFVSGDEYDTWFVPVTDNYKIIEIVQEDNQFGSPCWYQRMGGWVYGSEEPYFNEDVKTVYLLSFDEFGLVDSKMKVIYESETALQSDIYYNLEDYIVAEVLTGVNQPDDSLITTEFVESCDKEVFNNYSIDNGTFTYEYLGHSERVRYLSYNYSFESEIHEFWDWGTTADYSDFQYSSNEIFEGKMDNNGYPFPYRTYYCEPYPNATILNND